MTRNSTFFLFRKMSPTFLCFITLGCYSSGQRKIASRGRLPAPTTWPHQAPAGRGAWLWVRLCWTQPSFTLTVSPPGLAPPQLTGCRHQNLLSSYLPMVDPARAPRSFCLWASWTSAAPLPGPDHVSPSLCVSLLVSLYLCLLCLHRSLSHSFAFSYHFLPLSLFSSISPFM